LALGLCSVPACGPKATTATIPGSLNNADAQIYQNMQTAQAAIEQAKKDIASFPAAKDTLNKVIASYNTAEAAYQTYHASANPSPDPVALRAQVSQLMTDIGAMQKAMVKK
jgi:selenocysteine lyase/cysteine desulfurase